ncbi:hypothetical protein [Haloglomus halophilum]|uniref:hypothetical protein n=1 Tax=Haloglomus halophilum TaxID=2962672 RepID=UPI0020C99E51|nr:hypothetical protein [Haloglomus halophilum]
MTEDTPDDTEPKTLGELSHTNPFTNKAFGATQTYDRGRTIAADGGEAEVEATADEASADTETATDGGEAEAEELQDVEHTPPGDAEGTNGVYERGHEGREENR